MKFAHPEAFLISAPQLDWDEVRRYLDCVGGEAEEWANRVQNVIPDGEALVEFGGRLCYRSWEPGLNANVTMVRRDSQDYLGNILSSGHGSVLQHANYSFILHEVSRVLTHEMVRHTAGVAVSQESMRYVRLEEIPFWIPDWARQDPELMDRCLKIIADAEDFQRWAAEHFGLDDKDVPFSEKKHKTSFMRRLAPGGHATGMLMTVNVRALRHIIYMRSALSAEEEIRIIADQMADLALTATPNLMQDYSVDENREWVPEFMKV